MTGSYHVLDRVHGWDPVELRNVPPMTMDPQSRVILDDMWLSEPMASDVKD